MNRVTRALVFELPNDHFQGSLDYELADDAWCRLIYHSRRQHRGVVGSIGQDRPTWILGPVCANSTQICSFDTVDRGLNTCVNCFDCFMIQHCDDCCLTLEEKFRQQTHQMSVLSITKGRCYMHKLRQDTCQSNCRTWNAPSRCVRPTESHFFERVRSSSGGRLLTATLESAASPLLPTCQFGSENQMKRNVPCRTSGCARRPSGTANACILPFNARWCQCYDIVFTSVCKMGQRAASRLD